MSAKPSYLGLLNAIASGEAEAECYLTAWAEVTPRDDVRGMLTTIALREGEHAKAFAKRMCELGYSVRERPSPDAAERMAIASSTELSDREKLEQLDLVRELGPDEPDIFTGMFRDRTIDIQTGALLGRYIAEERDSGRLFRACHAALVAEEEHVAPVPASVEERLDRIERLLEKLVTDDSPPAEGPAARAARPAKRPKGG